MSENRSVCGALLDSRSFGLNGQEVMAHWYSFSCNS